MAISVRRLAQLAGVNPMTVSRAVRGREGVSADLRSKIVSLARKYGYPLPPARASESPDLLRVFAVAIDIEGADQNLETSFNRRLLAGLRKGAAECNTDIAMCEQDLAVWPLLADRQHVDGMVLVRGDETIPHPPFPPPVPAVFVFLGPEDADAVTADQFGSCRTLGLHLATLGHRRVAYIGPETEISRRRLAGLRTGLETAGGSVPAECVRIMPGAGARESAVELIDSLLEGRRSGKQVKEDFTALMAYNDFMAAAAILRLRERRVRVPEDLSVVGFDAVTPPWYDHVPMTTVAIPLEEVGAEATRFLYWRIAHPAAPRRRLVLSTTFVPGKTTRNL